MKFYIKKQCKNRFIKFFEKKYKKSVDKEKKLMYNKNRSAQGNIKSTLKNKQKSFREKPKRYEKYQINF